MMALAPRSAVVLALCGLVGACTAKFEPDSETRISATSGTAVVVIGTAISRYPEIESLGLTAYGASKTFEVGWAPIDPVTRELVPGREWFWLTRLGGSSYFGFLSEDKREVAHFVRAIPEGTYILAAVSNQDEGPYARKQVTSFIGLEGGRKKTTRLGSGLFRDREEGLRREGPVGDSGSPTFTVKAGEVVYLGDFVFDVIPESAKLVKLGRDDRAAAKALAEYPNIPGRLEFRPPDRTTDAKI